MSSLTDEQIAAARSVDLLSYLEAHEPGSIKKSGPREYCLREHDSLKISNGKWFWFSRDIGSNNALDFLVQVRGLEFNFKDICFPTTKEGRAQMNQVIMDAYNEALLGKEQTAQRPSAAEKLNDAKKEAAKAPKEPKAAKGSKAKADPGIE